MNDSTRELACIAASVAGHCRPCFQYHLKKAQELNIPIHDIEAVIDIAKEISASGDKHIIEFAKSVLRKQEKKDIEND